MSITSRVAIVTGAARGIGRAIALRLARDGLNVVVNDLPRMKSDLESLTSEIKSLKQQSIPVYGDVSNEDDVKKLITSSVETFGSLDVMIANAGIALVQPLVEISVDDWDRVNRINVRGTFLTYKHAALQMIKQGRGGRIIGASSIAGKQGFPEWAAYAASKFAVKGLTQTAATEFQEHGITVNAYCPGPVTTGIWGEVVAHRQSQGLSETIPVPNWKPTELDDVSGLVSYLVREEAKNITGQSINVNAGIFFD